MSRIVVTTIGSLGDLHPKLAIALELQRRGHDVVVATHREYRAKVEALDLRFHRLRPDNTALDDPAEMARMMDLKTGTEYVIRNWVGGNLYNTYVDLMTCAQDADFLVAGEGVLAARLVAEKLRIAWALAVLQPASFMSVYDPSVLPVLPILAKFRGLGAIASRAVRQLSKRLTQTWAEPIHKLRRELGLPPLAGNPFIDDKYSPYLVLVLFSSAFASPQPDWPRPMVQTGFAFYDGGGAEADLPPALDQFLAAGESPIVFTLGSAAVMAPGNFYTESLDATQRLQRRAVLLIGKNAPPDNLPEGMIAVDYVPYSQLFPRARAIVHQGGIGTTAQALRAGRPTLIMPYSHDQPDNADRARRLGTSLTIPRDRYTSQSVAKALQELLENPGYAAQAASLGRIIQTENGVTAACDAIEAQLQTASVRYML